MYGRQPIFLSPSPLLFPLPLALLLSLKSVLKKQLILRWEFRKKHIFNLCLTYFHFLWTLLRTKVSFEAFAFFHHLIIASIFQLLLKRLFLSPGNVLALKVRNRSFPLSSSKEKHFRNKRHCWVVITLFFSPKAWQGISSAPHREVFQFSHYINNLCSIKGMNI